ncbi:CasA protein, variant 3 [Coprinopsis cinerea AmutBmut pab1-1]|nr:CasA protein, variant 3 [Coprinopsis cinerea AmutBmut pab1-1]
MKIIKFVTTASKRISRHASLVVQNINRHRPALLAQGAVVESNEQIVEDVGERDDAEGWEKGTESRVQGDVKHREQGCEKDSEAEDQGLGKGIEAAREVVEIAEKLGDECVEHTVYAGRRRALLIGIQFYQDQPSPSSQPQTETSANGQPTTDSHGSVQTAPATRGVMPPIADPVPPLPLSDGHLISTSPSPSTVPVTTSISSSTPTMATGTATTVSATSPGPRAPTPKTTTPQSAVQTLSRTATSLTSVTPPPPRTGTSTSKDLAASSTTLVSKAKAAGTKLASSVASIGRSSGTTTSTGPGGANSGHKKVASSTSSEAVGGVSELDELKGCHNDVADMRKVLIELYAYKPEDIVVMLDQPVSSSDSSPWSPESNQPEDRSLVPTKDNILRELEKFTEDVKAGDRLFFFFAGHSMQEPTDAPDEEDGMDELIITSDHLRIRDDTLRALLVDRLPVGATLFAVFDSCHSASLLDLPHFRCNRCYVPWRNKGRRKSFTLWNNQIRKDARPLSPNPQPTRRRFPGLPMPVRKRRKRASQYGPGELVLPPAPGEGAGGGLATVQEDGSGESIERAAVEGRKRGGGGEREGFSAIPASAPPNTVTRHALPPHFQHPHQQHQQHPPSSATRFERKPWNRGSIDQVVMDQIAAGGAIGSATAGPETTTTTTHANRSSVPNGVVAPDREGSTTNPTSVESTNALTNGHVVEGPSPSPSSSVMTIAPVMARTGSRGPPLRIQTGSTDAYTPTPPRPISYAQAVTMGAKSSASFTQGTRGVPSSASLAQGPVGVSSGRKVGARRNAVDEMHSSREGVGGAGSVRESLASMGPIKESPAGSRKGSLGGGVVPSSAPPISGHGFQDLRGPAQQFQPTPPSHYANANGAANPRSRRQSRKTDDTILTSTSGHSSGVYYYSSSEEGGGSVPWFFPHREVVTEEVEEVVGVDGDEEVGMKMDVAQVLELEAGLGSARGAPTGRHLDPDAHTDTEGVGNATSKTRPRAISEAIKSFVERGREIKREVGGVVERGRALVRNRHASDSRRLESSGVQHATVGVLQNGELHSTADATSPPAHSLDCAPTNGECACGSHRFTTGGERRRKKRVRKEVVRRYLSPKGLFCTGWCEAHKKPWSGRGEAGFVVCFSAAKDGQESREDVNGASMTQALISILRMLFLSLV